MSRQFRVYLLPADIESLFAKLRAQYCVRLLLENSPTSTPVELESPIQSWPANPKTGAHSCVWCRMAAPSGADIRMWYAAKRAEWLLAAESEIIEFTGCDFDGNTLAEGRFYFQTDKLVGDSIVPKRAEFLTWADRIFRTTKSLLRRSRALDAYLGPLTVQWWKDGGRLTSRISGKQAYDSEMPDL